MMEPSGDAVTNAEAPGCAGSASPCDGSWGPCAVGAEYCFWIQDFERAAPFAAIEDDVGLAGDEARLRDVGAMCAGRIAQREHGVPASR